MTARKSQGNELLPTSSNHIMINYDFSLDTHTRKTMLAKIKSLIGSNSPTPPPPSSTKSTSGKGKGPPAAPSTKRLPKGQTTSSAPTLPSPPPPPVSALYQKIKSEAGVLLFEKDRHAAFQGTLDPDSLLPVEGYCVYPSGTELRGVWVAGLFHKGTATFASNLKQTHEGTFMPVEKGEESMNDGVGVKLYFGCVKDLQYRVVSTGYFGVYKQQYTRLIRGVRLSVLPGAPTEPILASDLPTSAVCTTTGVFSLQRVFVTSGSIVSNAVVSAGWYRIDVGSNFLTSGITWSAAGQFQGYIRRKSIYENGSLAVANAVSATRQTGLWRRGEGGASKLHIGVRTTMDVIARPAIDATPSSAEATDGDAATQAEVHMLEVGSFSMLTKRMQRTGRRIARKANVESEGLFCPISGGLLCGMLITHRRGGRVSNTDGNVTSNAMSPTVSFKETTKELFVSPVGSCSLRNLMGVGGFRKWWMQSTNAQTVSSFAETAMPMLTASDAQSAALHAAVNQLPSLAEQEVLELERAWYEGLSSVELSSGRGTVLFGENLHDGAWDIIENLANGQTRLNSLTWEERSTEAVIMRERAIASKGLSSAPFLVVSSDQQASLQAAVCDRAVTLRRVEWHAFEVTLDDMVTRLDRGLLFNEADQEALNEALTDIKVSVVPTSLGYVNLRAALRVITKESPSEEDDVEERQIREPYLRGDRCGREDTLRHPLFERALTISQTPPDSKQTPAKSRDEAVVRIAHRHHFSFREELLSASYTRRFVMSQVQSVEGAVAEVIQSDNSAPAEKATPASPPSSRSVAALSVSTAVHVPLPPDHECPNSYRSSWAFVIEYLHWIALRFGCVALMLPKDQSQILMKLSLNHYLDQSRETFMEDVDAILAKWVPPSNVEEDGDTSAYQESNRKQSCAPIIWPEGIVCRFLGDPMNCTSAACEVSMWMSRRMMDGVVHFPSSWTRAEALSKPTATVAKDNQGPQVQLYALDATSAEYADVHNCLYGMQFPSTWKVVRIERVHNAQLYDRYVQKRRAISRECCRMHLEKQADEKHEATTTTTNPLVGCNEIRWLAHGTKGKEPLLIARNGFDHRYSEVGLFGRAAYFAYDPIYSHSYRHETETSGQAQMFLASVTAGNVEMRSTSDKEIRHPKPGCHSVDGPLSERYRGLMVYDLDQAFPAYLVTYNFAPAS